MSTKLESKILSIMSVLGAHRIPLNKVVLHKFFYFAQTKRLNLGLRFEPWKYGPYSFDLAKNLDELVFWDSISLDDNVYNVSGEIPEDTLTTEEVKQLQTSISEFKLISNEDYSFTNMEIIGTILYCSSSLTANGIVPNAKSIEAEFIEWKGDKYPQ